MRFLKILLVTIALCISASFGMDFPAAQTNSQGLIFCLSIMKNIRFYDEIFNRLCQDQNTITVEEEQNQIAGQQKRGLENLKNNKRPAKQRKVLPKATP